MKIEMKKEYTTRDGDSVRIFCVDAKNKQPIVGEHDGDICQWHKDGTFFRDHSSCRLDLIEKPIPIVRYVPVFAYGGLGSCKSDYSSCAASDLGHIKLTITGKDVKTEFIPR